MYTYSDYKKQCLLKEKEKELEKRKEEYDQRERHQGRRYKLTKLVSNMVKRIRGLAG